MDVVNNQLGVKNKKIFIVKALKVGKEAWYLLIINQKGGATISNVLQENRKHTPTIENYYYYVISTSPPVLRIRTPLTVTVRLAFPSFLLTTKITPSDAIFKNPYYKDLSIT